MKKNLLVLILSFSIFANDTCNNALKTIKAVASDNAYAKAFKQTVKKAGSLNTRAEQFAAKWPNNVKIVDNVNLKFSHANGNGQGQKKMVIISLDGLDSSKSDELLKDYTDYLSWNAMSFPLGSGGGHLYTRVGDQAIDYFFGFNQNIYRWPSSDRLETVLELSDKEFKNMKQYIENLDINHRDVIGGSNYEGVNPIAGSTLASNKPASGGHNCTSWIATAPIGENGQTLKDVVGAGGWDVHRNPGWWTAYIQTKTNRNKNPFVVYVTHNPMDQAIQKTQAPHFEWNYDLH